MLMSLEEERRRNGEAQHSNFVEIFKGSNLVGECCTFDANPSDAS